MRFMVVGVCCIANYIIQIFIVVSFFVSGKVYNRFYYR